MNLCLRVALVLSVGSLAACAKSPEKDLSQAQCQSGPPVVKVVDNAYEPEVVCVKSAETVRWEWGGRAVHDVAGEGFKSELQRDGKFEHRFMREGTFTYRCTVHTGMVGEVRVDDF